MFEFLRKILFLSVFKMSCLSDEQRYYLKFMALYLNYEVDQIRNHSSMVNAKTNKPFQKRAIVNWLNRLTETGDVKLVPKTGRTKLLNKKEEELLIKTIRKNPKLRFKKIRALGFRQIGVRSVNRYANRNGYRKF